MCRVEFMVALARAMGRPPTDEERTAFLAAMAEQSGGEYLYVPKLPQSEIDPTEILRLRADGMSIRKIARRCKCSKSWVGKVLRQGELSTISPYVVDNIAA